MCDMSDAYFRPLIVRKARGRTRSRYQLIYHDAVIKLLFRFQLKPETFAGLKEALE